MVKKNPPQTNETFWQKYWIYLIPLLLCSLVMLPRMLDPVFGLMDDGDVIQKASLIVNGQWGPGLEASTGRFRPLFWYIHYLLFLLFGTNPAGYFLVNFLVFASLILIVIKLLDIYGSSKPVILVTIVFFILSGPIVESFYTLSKYEIFQLLFICLSILMSEYLFRSRSIIVKILLGVGVILFSLVSYLIKETSLVMPAIYLGWLIVLLIKYWPEKHRLQSLIIMTLGAFIAGFVYYVWRSEYFSEVITQGSYVGNHFNLSLGFLKESIYGWYPWLKRDFSYCLVLFVVLLIDVIFMRRKPRYLDIYLGSIIWMVGWLGVFLPWVIKIEYYLLPFSLGCCVMAGHILMELLESLRRDKLWNRLVIIGGLGVACVFFLISSLLIINNARYQLTMDKVNGQMLKYLVNVLPENGVVYVNLPADNEYVKEIELHLKYIYERPDVDVSRFYFQSTDTMETLTEAYVVTPVVTNRPVYSIRHAFNEDDSTAWSYLIEKYMTNGIGDPIIFSGTFRQIEPHFSRIVCPLFPDYRSCSSAPQILEFNQLSYQWSIYPYRRLLNKADQPGVFNCGLWRLRRIDGTDSIFRFGGCDDTPIVGDWNNDAISDLGIYSPQTNEWKIDSNHDGQPDLVFSLGDMITGDIPLIGDWDGDGRDSPGFFRASSQIWQLYDGPVGAYQASRSIKGGTASSIPLVGDWNRDLVDSWGIYIPETGDVNLENEFYGELAGMDYQLPANSSVIVGDWYGTGRDTLAFIDKTDWVILPANCGCTYPNFPPPYRYGFEDGIPVSGYWP